MTTRSSATCSSTSTHAITGISNRTPAPRHIEPPRQVGRLRWLKAQPSAGLGVDRSGSVRTPRMSGRSRRCAAGGSCVSRPIRGWRARRRQDHARGRGGLGPGSGGDLTICGVSAMSKTRLRLLALMAIVFTVYCGGFVNATGSREPTIRSQIRFQKNRSCPASGHGRFKLP